MGARALAIAAAALLSASAGFAEVEPEAAAPGVRLAWAFGARPAGNPDALVPLHRDTTLESGSRLKLLIQPTGPCFVYVLHHGPDGAVTLLFPSHPNAGIGSGGLHYVPPGDSWITLDDEVGAESFVLLASAQRLVALERLLSRRESGSGEADRAILDEIDRLRRSQSLSKPAIRPITIGGRVRGEDATTEDSWSDRLAALAVEFTAAELFARTITIDHR